MCSYIASIEPQHTGGRWPTGLVGEQINFMSNEGINWSFVCIVKHMHMHMHRSKSRLFTQDMSIIDCIVKCTTNVSHGKKVH